MKDRKKFERLWMMYMQESNAYTDVILKNRPMMCMKYILNKICEYEKNNVMSIEDYDNICQLFSYINNIKK